MTWKQPRTWRPGDVARNLTARVLNEQLRDELQALYDLVQALYDEFATDWIDATYQAGWSDYSGTEAGAGYRKVGKTVSLRGIVTSAATPPSTIFILPAGFIPPSSVRTLAAADGTTAEVWVNAAGAVRLVSGTAATWLSLDGISFRVS